MKKIQSMLVALLLVVSARAQNTFPSTGNVGIGTTSPQYPLDITGTIALRGSPAFDATTISTPGDGTYVIASGTRLKGEYILSFEGAYRVQTAHLLINAGGYDLGSTIQVLENHSYTGNVVMRNFRLLSSADQSIQYLAMDIGDRNGGTVVNAQYQGSAKYGAAWGGTLVGNETTVGKISLASVEGNVGIGTTNPGAQLDISNINAASLLRLTSGGPVGTYHLDARSFSPAAGVVSYAFDVLNNGSPYSNSLTFSGYNGYIGIGTASPGAKLDVAGSLKLSGGGASITFPDNSVQSTAWNGTLCGGDYAESVDVSGDRKRYEAGDVLVIDSSAEGKFLKSVEPYSTSVMGIYSTKPGLTGRRQATAKSPNEVPMAMMGIVPTKVSAENGPISPGDLLVTSSTPGFAMRGTDHSRMLGALIGKALGHLDSGTGVIEVGVTLQ